MCFLFFHKMPKWSEVKEDIWISKWKDNKGENIKFIKLYQDRFCEDCNKYEIRYIGK